MLDFILANLPIIMCFLVGVGLLIVEVFLPGFGLPGIAGIILQFITIWLTWASYGPVAALGMTIVILAVVAIAISISLKSAARGRLSRSSIVNHHQESLRDGYNATGDMEVFLGKEGITSTVLRPAGIAEFDGVRLNVVSEGEFINANTSVRIERVDGPRILVRPIS
jgi:membrane-bound ClpP family serine protease